MTADKEIQTYLEKNTRLTDKPDRLAERTERKNIYVYNESIKRCRELKDAGESK